MRTTEFQKFIAAAVEKHGRKAIAEMIGMSPQSVDRWADGRNAPHPRLVSRVIEKIMGY